MVCVCFCFECVKENVFVCACAHASLWCQVDILIPLLLKQCCHTETLYTAVQCASCSQAGRVSIRGALHTECVHKPTAVVATTHCICYSVFQMLFI